MTRRQLTRIVTMTALAALSGCGELGTTGTPDMGPALTACKDPLSSVYTLPDGLPAYDASHRGDVVRCAFDKNVTAAQVNAAMTAFGYAGPALPSGSAIYRVAYRTERAKVGMGPAAGGTSSALLFMPDKPIPGALIVAAHGTVGLADKCAPSRTDVLSTDPSLYDAYILDLLLAGYGWTVIAPDYTGFGYGSTSGWLLSEDEAKGLLDATRAVKKIVPSDMDLSKVALVGHSQGGHAVLSAHALASTYGLQGQLVGVAAFAGIWFTAGTWGAALSNVADLNTTDHAKPIEFSMNYFYGHGELYDGPGGGFAMYQAGKRDQVKQILQNNCLEEVAPLLKTLGAKPTDFFEPTFVEAIQNCVLGADCSAAPSSTWKDRFRADRPAIDPKGAPLLLFQGGKDGTLMPPRAQCGFDKINTDLMATMGATTTVKICADPDADHESVMWRNSNWVNQWIAARALGRAEPPACPDLSTLGAIPCPGLPPNVD